MTIAQLIAQLRAQMATRLAERNTNAEQLAQLRGADNVDETEVERLRSANVTIDAELDQQQARVAELEAEQARDDAAQRLAGQVNPTGNQGQPYDQTARVGAEERTYREDQDPKGVRFLTDVALQFIRNDPGAAERLSRHMSEELVERGGNVGAREERAGTTANWTGLVVPQYLTDLFAPKARAGRPFADACNHHDLPETGMTAYIGAVTTGSTVDDQANEGDAANDSDLDDTLISVPIRTAAGQTTLSRQAIERGVGVDEVTIQDMYGAHATNLDGKLINRATTGLSAVATAVSYTDASPTVPELYPKFLSAASGVEAAMLNQMQIDDLLYVMQSRRWHWLNSALSSTWPLMNQPGVAVQNAGINYGEVYGSGFRGLLPNGAPVVVDNNILTNYGAGTNEDEIYTVARSECHLWEDPNAPMLIRAEQAKAANLQVLLVVYSYYASLFTRRAHAQKINGTGLVTPAFA